MYSWPLVSACCVLAQNSLFSQYLSPPRIMSGCWRNCSGKLDKNTWVGGVGGGGGGGNLLLSSFPCFRFSSTPRFCVLWKLDLSAGYGYPWFFKNPWIRDDLYSREFLLSLLLLLQRQTKKSRWKVLHSWWPPLLHTRVKCSNLWHSTWTWIYQKE